MSQRRKFGVQFKAKVALEALKGLKTINEIAAQYEVHPNQVAKWKRHLIDQLPTIFSNPQARIKKADDKLNDRLYEQIGRLKVELDWLKKKTGSDY